MIVDDNTDAGSLPLHVGNLGGVGIPRDNPVAGFIVTNVMFADAGRDEVESSLVPNPLPTVEEIDHLLF
ncbi:hypothetical protein XH79_41380 [Bradyrhizobium sp. CCBAU 45389]|nr:hypothetical protein [Bradyrhizobium sp. CCBAU 45389]